MTSRLSARSSEHKRTPFSKRQTGPCKQRAPRGTAHISPSTACTTATLYKAPLANAVVNSSEPLTVSWDTTCFNDNPTKVCLRPRNSLMILIIIHLGGFEAVSPRRRLHQAADMERSAETSPPSPALTLSREELPYAPGMTQVRPYSLSLITFSTAATPGRALPEMVERHGDRPAPVLYPGLRQPLRVRLWPRTLVHRDLHRAR